MTKYIIKNCPNFDNTIWQEPSCNKYPCDCQTKTDCLVKQMVEKCINDTCKIVEQKTNKFLGYRTSPLAEEILSMLEIEECE